MQRFSLAAAAAVIALAGCSTGMSTLKKAQVQGPSATAKLEPTQGNQVRGTVHFTQVGGELRIKGQVTGLKPSSEHGFHVHEKGDCSSGDGTSAGGHFNPHNTRHGMPMGAEHHTGDLPSLLSDATGTAKIDVKISGPRVGSGADDIVGRGLIVHEKRDDFMSQPTGDAGARVACAVIRTS